MAIQMQVFPLPNGPCPITVNGRSYVGTVGTYQTVPLADGQVMIANNWISSCVKGCGSTTDRPLPGTVDVQAGRPGTTFHDTTVGALIAWDGFAWRNVLTGNLA